MSITWTRNKALLAVLLIMMAVLGRNIASQAEDLSNADLPNPDSYYKLVILKDYTPETGFQFIARDNAPYGSWIHWSLPHTWIVWQLHRGLMALGLDKNAALLWAGGGLTMLSMLLLAFFVALAVANVGSPMAAIVSSLVIASSPPLFGYGQLLQITHHIFMLVPLAAAGACFFRHDFKASFYQDLLGGMLMGAAIWVSPETMPLVFAFTGIRIAIRLQVPNAGPVWPVSSGFLGVLLIGWLMDPPPPTFSSWAFDHISFTWLLFGALLSYLMLQADSCSLRRQSMLVSVRELALALMVMAVIWLSVVPNSMVGLGGVIPDDLRALWFDRIGEIRAVNKPSQWLAYLLLPLVSASLLSFIAWRERSLWMLMLTIATFMYGILGAAHIRIGAAAAVVSVFSFCIGISKLKSFSHMHDNSLPMREQLVSALLVLIIPMQAFGTIGLEYFEEELSGLSGMTQSDSCRVSQVLPLLVSLEPSTVLADANFGPEILFKTRNNIISGNYHHNVQGLMDSFSVLRSIAPDEYAISIVSTRKIDYVLVCNAINSNLAREDGATVAQRISTGKKISWLPWRRALDEWHIYRSAGF